MLFYDLITVSTVYLPFRMQGIKDAGMDSVILRVTIKFETKEGKEKTLDM